MDTENKTTALPGMAGAEESLGDHPRDRNPLPSPPKIKAGEHEVIENSFGDGHDADEITRSENNEIASNEKKSNQSNPDELGEDANGTPALHNTAYTHTLSLSLSFSLSLTH